MRMALRNCGSVNGGPCDGTNTCSHDQRTEFEPASTGERGFEPSISQLQRLASYRWTTPQRAAGRRYHRHPPNLTTRGRPDSRDPRRRRGDADALRDPEGAAPAVWAAAGDVAGARGPGGRRDAGGRGGRPEAPARRPPARGRADRGAGGAEGD